MGADQSLQTPEEHQRSIEAAKAKKEKAEQDEKMAQAAKIKQAEIDYQNLLNRREADANKNYKSYAADIVKLILKQTVENHEHKTLYFITFWHNDKIRYVDVDSYCSTKINDWGQRLHYDRLLKRMRYSNVAQEVKKLLAGYGYECAMLDSAHSPLGDKTTYYNVYFSVAKTQAIASTYSNSHNIFVAPSS